MNLADRIVALGVGYNYHGCSDHYGTDEKNPDWNKLMPADEFTHSWEVAGALMEKCYKVFAEALNGDTGVWAVRADGPTKTREWYEANSLPYAVIQACVEALEHDHRQ